MLFFPHLLELSFDLRNLRKILRQLVHLVVQSVEDELVVLPDQVGVIWLCQLILDINRKVLVAVKIKQTGQLIAFGIMGEMKLTPSF